MPKYDIEKLDFRLSAIQRGLTIDDLNTFYSVCFEAEYKSLLDKSAWINVEEWVSSTVAKDMVAIDLTDTKTIACLNKSELVGKAIYAERQRLVYVWGMYVHPQSQRTGVGSRLLHEISCLVDSKSIFEVSVIQQSIGAVNFYNKFGFRPYKAAMMEVFPNVQMPVEQMQSNSSTIRSKSS